MGEAHNLARWIGVYDHGIAAMACQQDSRRRTRIGWIIVDTKQPAALRLNFSRAWPGSCTRACSPTTCARSAYTLDRATRQASHTIVSE